MTTSSDLLPRAPAPELRVDTLGGDGFTLADRSPEKFTLVVFYRGLHCPICKTYLSELEGMLGDFTERGVEVIAVSGDSAEKAGQAAEEWGLDELTVGYGLSTEAMAAWGLFVSDALNDDEADRFNEPGLFLVAPDGNLFYAAINSMPFGRPALKEIVGGVDFVVGKGYPARGEVDLTAAAAG